MKQILIFFIWSFLLPSWLLSQSTIPKFEKPTVAEVKEQYAKYKEFDYFNYDYKYLDEDFRIVMDNVLFNQLLKMNNFYADRIISYKDSLAVALCGEFDTWPQRNIAHFRITYTWNRLSYMLWVSEIEAMNIAEKYSFHHPYLLYQYVYKHPEQWDQYMIDFTNDLRKRIYSETANEEVLIMNNKELMNYAHVNSPKRLADLNSISKQECSSTDSKKCTDPNCCQIK